MRNGGAEQRGRLLVALPNNDKGLGFVARYGGSDATDRILKDSAGKPSKRY
jgi:hypothetical protein